MKKLIAALLLSSLLGVHDSVAADETVKEVKLIFKTHLDIGFTDLGNNVVRTYLQEFIPSALTLSESIAQSDSELKYPWTTGSWLLWKYMNSSSQSGVKQMEAAINRNDFFWHAFPFTMQAELCDSSLFSAAFDISHQLDARFGRQTTAAKMTDVPGITRSIIPVMRRNGVSLLLIGTNPCVPFPQVPGMFRWRNVDGSEINVVYQLGYGDFIKIPGTDIAAFLCFTSDNHGPHTQAQIADMYRAIQSRFPHAKIVASSLSDVADLIEKYSKEYLPVVTQEIGDTWIWGVASDPKKIAEFRVLMNLRNKWLKQGDLVEGDRVDQKFTVPLLMVTEHTWGLDVKWNLHNWDKYSPEAFQTFVESDVCRRMEDSWNEKRAFIYEALAALPAKLQREAFDALAKLTPSIPETTDMKKCAVGKNIDLGKYVVVVDEQGAITRLYDKSAKTEWLTGEKRIGEFSYQTFSENTFHRFIDSYCPPNPPDWAKLDYGKNGLASTNTPDSHWYYSVQGIYKQKNKDISTLIVALEKENNIHTYGAPKSVYVSYEFNDKSHEISVELNWFDKNKTRIPEAIWFSFVPDVSAQRIEMDKMGYYVDANDVVENGSRHMHAVTGDVNIIGKDRTMQLESIDAPVVALNKSDMMYFDNTPVDPGKGVYFALYNNTWGTNYTQWFGDDMKYRFNIKLKY